MPQVSVLDTISLCIPVVVVVANAPAGDVGGGFREGESRDASPSLGDA